jgi:hypothetical protein
MSLNIALRQVLHRSFFGMQALLENRGAYVSTHFGPLSRLSKEDLLKTKELDGRIYFEGLLTSLKRNLQEEPPRGVSTSLQEESPGRIPKTSLHRSLQDESPRARLWKESPGFLQASR